MGQHRQLWIITIIAIILVGVSVYLSAGGDTCEDETVSVRVEGAVRQPGSLVLVNGMRVIDAIDACGGILPDAKMDGVDVSAELTEGQVIHVASTRMSENLQESESMQSAEGSQEEKSSSKPTKKKKKAEAKAEPANMTSGSLNINTASARQLERLPGIGPALAGAIVEYRSVNGRFATIVDIQRVKGIGKKKYEKMKPFIRTE